tara:strand:- start:29 stop:145 length:117 start_codon:yes stop_codon:yes gene_type:complete
VIEVGPGPGKHAIRGFGPKQNDRLENIDEIANALSRLP